MSDTEGGASELYEYAKSALTALALAVVASRSRVSIFWVLSGFFAFATLDNWVGLHESFFDFTTMSGFEGELAYFGLTTLIFIALFYAFWPAGRQAGRIEATQIVMAIVFTAFCAVVIDAAHSIIGMLFGRLQNVLGYLEDGGEMVGLSISLALAVAMVVAGQLHRPQDN